MIFGSSKQLLSEDEQEIGNIEGRYLWAGQGHQT